MLALGIIGMCIYGCAASSKGSKHRLSISTTPPDALVCVGAMQGGDELRIQAMAGSTPLEKEFQFGPENRLWLQIEKRGYAPRRIAVTPASGPVSLQLERIYQADGNPASEFEFPEIQRMLLVSPDFSIYERGFSSEKVSEEASSQAQKALITGIINYFDGRWETIVPSKQAAGAKLKSLWRDGNTAMAMINPIHLPYQSEPVLLETSSGRAAARKLGEQYHADVVVLVAGKQTVETGSMIAGKIGMTVIGTASSYASGYSRAMANGDSFFVYTVYTPQFSQGAQLKAMMINCRNGEVLWINQGFWKPIRFQDANVVGSVIEDLFTGLTDQ